MTYEEALAILRTHKTYVGEMDADKLIEALNIAEAAIEMQIPKKPNAHFGSFCDDFTFVCPNCTNPIVIDWSNTAYKPFYCHYCGQALDWSDEK